MGVIEIGVIVFVCIGLSLLVGFWDIGCCCMCLSLCVNMFMCEIPEDSF